MRNACKNIMYTVVHSWMYDGRSQAAEGDGWKTMVYVLDAVAVAALAAVEAGHPQEPENRKQVI